MERNKYRSNIDSINLFKVSRPDDININLAVADYEGESDYYKFLEIDVAGGGSGNSLRIDYKNVYERQGIKSTTLKVQTDRLCNILKKYALNKQIDFLNIDIEGFDLQVLKSNNWELFRPKVIAVEIWLSDIDYDKLYENETYKFLRLKNYKPFSNTINTWFFYDLNSDFAI